MPTKAEEEPMSQNGTQTTTQDAVARAMEASAYGQYLCRLLEQEP